MRPLILLISTFSLLLGQSVFASSSETLIDKDLSRFGIWMGVPHATVEGLPEGTYQSTNVQRGEAMGLNADVKNVFSVIEEGGEWVLKITGEIYGGLTTVDEFENYHLSVQVRWGDKKWPPREGKLRDSGILYHCYGEHGAFWKVWKSSLEYQVQETDMGDFISLAGPKVAVRGGLFGESKRWRYDSTSDEFRSAATSAYPELDAPHGEWNQLDLYVVGNDAVHVVDGVIVLVVNDAHKPNGEPLTRGQIQIQSEAAEVYYKNMLVTPIIGFPEFIEKQARFKD